MDAYTQERRRLRIDTVLGRDHVLPVTLRGLDSISSFYAYDIELASTDHAIKAGDILGTAATVRLEDATGLYTTINGIVARFAVTGRDSRGFSLYRVRVVPSLWFLTRTSDCRIFQEKTVRDIVDAILGEHGIRHKEWRLSAEHEKRDYCVQYRETAYDFICRLLEEEGIFFYFRHDEKNHTVVFSDNNRGLTKCTNERVAISPDEGAPGGIWQWESTYRFRSGQWALGDYNFETPSTSLTTEKKTVNQVLAKRPFEMFDYPGRYLTKSPGDALTKLRIEYEEAAYQEASGEGACLGFAAGTYFSLSNADAREADKEYLVSSVEHSAEDWSQLTQDAKPATYSNRFRCALRSVPYRPEMKTERPRIHGTQTAVVTGPGGSEIFTDKYGRIKVQFHWDRQGKKDEHSSCWVRVAQSWAGRSFGTWYVPRIGQEVVVAFLEGDPDRPLVVGSVYNAEQTVPFPLPANATQSGLRTRSSMGGGAANCNEFRFEDKKGSELVSLHSEKDFSTETEHDATHSVGHDETTTVGNNRTETVHGNETITIDKNRTETVHMNETVGIDLNRSHTVDAGGDADGRARRACTAWVWPRRSPWGRRAWSPWARRRARGGRVQSIDVAANRRSRSARTRRSRWRRTRLISVGGNETIAVAKDRSANIGENETLEVGKKIMISAGEEIVLKTGSATITMKKNGEITIEGKQITIKGSGRCHH